MSRFIVGFDSEEREYTINGVRYIVESRYEPINFRNISQNTELGNRLKSYIAGDFADLPSPTADGKIDAEYVCTAAEKEEHNAAENK